MKRELAALATPPPAAFDSSRKTRAGANNHDMIVNGVSPERLVYKRVKRSGVKDDKPAGPIFRGVVEPSKPDVVVDSSLVEENVVGTSAVVMKAEEREAGVAQEAEAPVEVGGGNSVENGVIEAKAGCEDERVEGSVCKSPAKRVYGKRKKSVVHSSERRVTRSASKPSDAEEVNAEEEKAVPEEKSVLEEKAEEMLVQVNVVSEGKVAMTLMGEEECAKEGGAKPKEETDSCLTETSDNVMPDKEEGVEGAQEEEEAGVSHENVVECNLLETHVEEAETMTFPSRQLSYPIGRVRAPQTVRELFETGLLEGCPVYYDGGKGPTLRGKIRSIGILCPCDSCLDRKVVPPSMFEIHASDKYRRAVEYIYLENGRSLIQVLKACRMNSPKTAEERVANAIGPVRERKVVSCLNCKEQYSTMDVECLEPVCSSCILSNVSSIGPIYAARRLCRAPKFVFPSSAASAGDMLQACSPDKLVVNSVLQQSAKKSNKRSYKRKVRCSHQIQKTSKKNSAEKISKNSQDASLEPKTRSSRAVRKYSSPKASKKSVKKSFEAALSPKASGLTRVGKSPQKDSGLKTEKRLRKEVLTPKSLKSPSISKSSDKKSTGKITRKDTRLHKLVFEDDVLPDGTELAYFVRGQKLLDGFKKGAGIFCNCCETVVSPSLFEAHAGCAARRKPYCYIYTSNGVSLHELSINLIKSRRQSIQYNDDLCSICADGGTLLLCDSCPRAFHTECASLSSKPRGKWYCKYCENMFEREKFVSYNNNAVAAGRVSGVDPMEQITERSIRIVNSVGSEVSSCILCRQFDFCKSGFGPRTIILCDQCEKEYHVGCLRDHKMADLKELPDGKWFCSTDCGRIDSVLHKILIQGAEKLPESLVNVIRKKNLQNGSESGTHVDISWRLLNGKIVSPETRPLLSQAVAIFHESFTPIIDVVSGHDLIPAMVYGRNVGGQEYGGMYCAVLTINSVVVSAGIFRVFGQEVAELPLVATSSGNHGKGYFQALFACIERQLALLEVKNFVLPAAEEAVSIWTDRFGFTKMTHDQICDLKRNYWSMVRFQGTSMLHKAVPSCWGVQRPAK